MKKFLSVAIVTLFAAVGCSKQDPNVKVKIERIHNQELKVVAVDPSKRFYLKLVDSEGRKYRAYSKRCSKWRQAKIGSKVKMDLLKKTETNIVTKETTVKYSMVVGNACTIASMIR